MKIFSWLTISLVMTMSLSAQTWTWETTPMAGENAVFTVDGVPQDKEVYMTFYGFDGMELVSGDVGLVPAERPDALKGAFVIHEHMTWVRVTLKDENMRVLSATEVVVNNPSSKAETADIEKSLASTLYGSRLGIERDDAGNLERLSAAIEANPAWMSKPDVIKVYYSLAKRLQATADMDRIRAWVSAVGAKPNEYGEDELVQASLAARDMGDTTLANAIRKKIDKKYPASSLAQQDMLNRFREAESLTDKIRIRDQFRKQFPVTKANRMLHDQMTGMIGEAYAAESDWAQARKYIDQMEDKVNASQMYNSIAWELSGESLDNPGKDLDVAAEMSMASLKLLEAARATPPTGLTKKEWGKVLDGNRGMFSDTYALVRYKQGHVVEAADYQAIAMEAGGADAEMGERHAVYLEKAGRFAELEKFLEEAIATGTSTAKLKEIHRTYWTERKDKADIYAQYLGQLEARAHAKLEAEVREKWQDADGIDFTLRDLEGKTVSLADYKGKTVVLDFWATWCGPCIMSFPGMQMAVEHYASDPDVVFLFVDTWERGEDAPARVENFIRENNYPFHVLMDREDKVVSAYGVTGIPTKFIIGPDQKIRFTSKGFGGSTEGLFEELKMMIEMTRRPVMYGARS